MRACSTPRSNRLAAVAVRAGQRVASVELSTARSRAGGWSATGSPRRWRRSTVGGAVPDRLFNDEVVGAALKECGGLVQPLPSALAEPGAAEARLKGYTASTPSTASAV